MMRMRIAIIVASAMLAAALGIAVQPASASASSGPALSPKQLFVEGFESSLLARTRVSWATPTPGDPLPAYWGRISQRRHSGATGLWCAGTTPAGASTGWTTYAGKYPLGTAAVATLDVPELADLYSARLDFWYDMPSLGAFDTESFNVLWAASGSPTWDGRYAQSKVSTMTPLSVALTAPTPFGELTPLNLSRTSGQVRFLFLDKVAGAAETENPFNGEGATIDDVSVSGYMFGPVRDLAAVASGGQVTLAWAKPARSTALLSPAEERPVAYRIWRSPNVEPYVWTEVTPVRTSATTFTDTDPIDGSARYVVQAWTPGDDSGWGEVDVAGAPVATVVPPVPITNITITGASSGGVFTELPTITVTRSSARGATYYRWDFSGPYASTADQTFTIAALTGTHTLEVYSTNSLGTAEAPEKTRVVVVNLPGPPPVAPETTITVTGTRNSAGTFTATPTITVTRDIADGTTYFRWDGGSYDSTTAVSFQLPALAGAHTLEVYSVSGGAAEATPRSLPITVVLAPVLTKPILSTPTLSTSYVRHKRTFYVRGSVKPSHKTSTTVIVRFYRYYSGAYHYYKSYTVSVKAGTTSFSAKSYLARSGTFRVRVYHGCSLHLGTYSAYKKFSVH